MSHLKLNLCQLKHISCEISPSTCWDTNTSYLNKVSQLWSVIKQDNYAYIKVNDWILDKHSSTIITTVVCNYKDSKITAITDIDTLRSTLGERKFACQLLIKHHICDYVLLNELIEYVQKLPHYKKPKPVFDYFNEDIFTYINTFNNLQSLLFSSYVCRLFFQWIFTKRFCTQIPILRRLIINDKKALKYKDKISNDYLFQGVQHCVISIKWETYQQTTLPLIKYSNLRYYEGGVQLLSNFPTKLNKIVCKFPVGFALMWYTKYSDMWEKLAYHSTNENYALFVIEDDILNKFQYLITAKMIVWHNSVVSSSILGFTFQSSKIQHFVFNNCSIFWDLADFPLPLDPENTQNNKTLFFISDELSVNWIGLTNLLRSGNSYNLFIAKCVFKCNVQATTDGSFWQFMKYISQKSSNGVAVDITLIFELVSDDYQQYCDLNLKKTNRNIHELIDILLNRYYETIVANDAIKTFKLGIFITGITKANNGFLFDLKKIFQPKQLKQKQNQILHTLHRKNTFGLTQIKQEWTNILSFIYNNSN